MSRSLAACPETQLKIKNIKSGIVTGHNSSISRREKGASVFRVVFCGSYKISAKITVLTKYSWISFLRWFCRCFHIFGTRRWRHERIREKRVSSFPFLWVVDGDLLTQYQTYQSNVSTSTILSFPLPLKPQQVSLHNSLPDTTTSTKSWLPR